MAPGPPCRSAADWRGGAKPRGAVGVNDSRVPRFPGQGHFLDNTRIPIRREARRVPSTVVNQASEPGTGLRGSS